MKRRQLVGFCFVVVAVLLLGSVILRQSKTQDVKGGRRNRSGEQLASMPKATGTPNNSSVASIARIAEWQKQAAATVSAVFDTPISFFGKVQDQNGVPISEANIRFAAIDKFWESGSNYQTTSNDLGFFSISGIKGAGLTVAVSKAGFAGIDGLSYQSFGYGMPPDSSRKAPPRKENPAVFVLRKKAAADPLFVVRRDVPIPKNGTPVEVSLKTGEPVPIGQGDLTIECWTSDNLKDPRGRYEWHARVAVPGGGLAPRTESERDFTAPESGYEPTRDFAMPRNAEPWRRDSDGQYWVRLANGMFARMRFRLTTGGGHFATIEAYLNPSGSRNLEYDEKKVIK